MPEFQVLVCTSAIDLTFADNVAHDRFVFMYDGHGWSWVGKGWVLRVPKTIAAGHIDFCVGGSVEISKRDVSSSFNGSKMSEGLDIGRQR